MGTRGFGCICMEPTAFANSDTCMLDVLNRLLGSRGIPLEIDNFGDGFVTIRLPGCGAGWRAWVEIGRRVVVLEPSAAGLSARFATRAGLKFITLRLVPEGSHPRGVIRRLIRVAGARPRGLARASFSPRAPSRVSVIVPNYNHAPYLVRRLESVYGQTRPPDEILLLDDASSDESAAILADFAARDPVAGRSRVLRNIVNSGSPFAQWARGLREATGEVVWIAESDDWCSPDFLGRMLPAFQDPAVLIAHGRAIFVNEGGQPLAQSLEKIHRSVGSRAVMRSGSISAHRFLREGMAIRNLVPNASAVVFRRPSPGFPLFDDPEWVSLRVCGDWIFYLHRLRGGKIAYVREARSYYRVRPESAAHSAQGEERYFREHAIVARHLMETFAIPGDFLDRQLSLLARHQAAHAREASGLRSPVEWYREAGLKAASARRGPAVCVAIHAFAPGGAEAFAIHMAVALRRARCAVTLLELVTLPSDPAVRARVPADLPVVRLGRPAEIARFLRESGIEMVNTHHPRADLALARALDMLPPCTRPRLFCTHHGFYHLDAGNLFRCRDLFHRHVSRWINVAGRGRHPFVVAGLLTHSAGDRFLELPAGIPLPSTLPPPLFPGRNQPFVVTVASRALPEKGWREAIAAIDRVRISSGRDIRLVLAGSGPVQEELERDKPPAFVSLLGFRVDVPNLYAQGHLGMLPTTYAGESCPLGVIECLAVGRPVVATSVGEIPSLLTSSGGVVAGALVAPGGGIIHSLAAAIEHLATDRSAYEHAASVARRCAERHDINTISRDYLAAWREVNEQPRSSCPH